MSEPVKVKIGEVTYKVHSDGDVFKVIPGFFESTLKVGKIPPSTPQNQLEEAIRDILPWCSSNNKNSTSDRAIFMCDFL